MGDNIITNMLERSTASGWALCLLVAGGLFAQWRIHAKQAPEMRKLDISEKAGRKSAESKATDDVIEQLRKELARMGERMGHLEERVEELEHEKRAVTVERDAALADNARLRAVNHGQGQARQDAATIVAIERAQDGLARRGVGE
jgi:predicted nuclease with TOPRIM domain